jgi:hypothetical protein
LASKPRALSPDEKLALEEMKPIEELFPRPTPDEQKSFIENIWFKDDKEEEVSDEVAEEINDDIPF